MEPFVTDNERHQMILDLQRKIEAITENELELRDEITSIENSVAEIFQRANEEAEPFHNRTDLIRAKIASFNHAAEGIRTAITNLGEIDGFGGHDNE